LYVFEIRNCSSQRCFCCICGILQLVGCILQLKAGNPFRIRCAKAPRFSGNRQKAFSPLFFSKYLNPTVNHSLDANARHFVIYCGVWMGHDISIYTNLSQRLTPGVCNRLPAGQNPARQSIWCGPCQHSDFSPSCIKILIRQFMLKNFNFRVAQLDVWSWLYGPPTKNVAHPWLIRIYLLYVWCFLSLFLCVFFLLFPFFALIILDCLLFFLRVGWHVDLAVTSPILVMLSLDHGMYFSKKAIDCLFDRTSRNVKGRCERRKYGNCVGL